LVLLLDLENLNIKNIELTQLKIKGNIVNLVRVAKTFDVPVGKMKHLEVAGTKILIANVQGKFYAVGDRYPQVEIQGIRGYFE
jgi:hypothetical protein